MQQIVRNIVFQPFDPQPLTVGITPTPLFPTGTKADLIASFGISVPAAAANNVFIGNIAVSLTNGLEIVKGAGIVLFRIINQNVQYDIHSEVNPAVENALCQPIPIQSIPFIVWDVTQISLIATAPTAISFVLFRSQFI